LLCRASAHSLRHDRARRNEMAGKRPRKQHRRDVSAGVIIFHRGPDGCRFLLLRSTQTRRPLWEFPKGGVDTGETLEEAALRELHEETGLSREHVRMVPGFESAEHYRFTAGDGAERTYIRKRVTYFLAESLRTEITISPAEASRFGWYLPAEARRKLRYKARRQMLDDALEAAGCGDAAQPETTSRSRDTSNSAGRLRA